MKAFFIAKPTLNQESTILVSKLNLKKAFLVARKRTFKVKQLIFKF